MVRDFTTEMEEKLYEYVNTRNGNAECSSLASNLEIERYSENCEDMEYMLSNLDTYHQGMLDNAFISKQFIETVFDRVRQYDLEFSNTVTQGMSMTLDPYKKAMNALLDSIRVPESNGTSSSIFVESNIFQDKINGIACGLVGETYLRLQDDEVFAELMAKSPEEIKVWEMMALIKMADDCLKLEDGTPGLNYERYAAFIEKGYIQTEMRDATFVTYTLSPVMGLLAEYLNIRADIEIATFYQINMGIETNLINSNSIINHCYQADILTSVITYYDQIKMAYNCPVDLSIECINTGQILISAQSNADEFEDIIIYSYSNDIHEEMENAKIDSLMTRLIPDQEMVWGSVGGEITAICIAKILEAAAEELPGVSTVENIYEGAMAVEEVRSGYQTVQEQNERIYQEMKFEDMDRYLRVTHCGGTVIQYGENITIQHLHMDEQEVLLEVMLYNTFCSDDSVPPMTVEDIKQNMNVFMEGGGTYDKLEALAGFDQGEAYLSLGCTYNKFQEAVSRYLNNNCEVDSIYNANEEQLQEAVEYVALKNMRRQE